MAETVSYVRRDFLPPLEAPSSDKTAWGWARRNLFASVTDWRSQSSSGSWCR